MSTGHAFGFLLVFQLSTRCNLECVYCNVDAGPRGSRPVLDPQVVEKWVEAFASLEPSVISIQLHGGEPLIVDPPVELYAAIVRNTLSRFPATRLGYLGVQSNGSSLDDARANSLAQAGVSINISIDGPASIHDRHRSRPGHSNHREALRAHHLLRARGKNTGIISVIADPSDVVPAVQFFLEEGFSEARMNPMRPEGRGLNMPQWDDTIFMRAMALEYFRAARLIAEHNIRRPDAPFFESNLSTLMQILAGEDNSSPMVFWTFLIDDLGDLWAHPSAHGVEALHLTRREIPSGNSLRNALDLAEPEPPAMADVASGIRDRMAGLFAACSTCSTPDFCVPVYGRRNNAEHANAMCIWMSELTEHLRTWLRDDPDSARRLQPAGIKRRTVEASA